MKPPFEHIDMDEYCAEILDRLLPALRKHPFVREVGLCAVETILDTHGRIPRHVNGRRRFVEIEDHWRLRFRPTVEVHYSDWTRTEKVEWTHIGIRIETPIRRLRMGASRDGLKHWLDSGRLDRALTRDAFLTRLPWSAWRLARNAPCLKYTI